MSRLTIPIVLLVVVVFIIGLWLATWYFVPKWYPVVTPCGESIRQPSDPGMFGDMFGVVNALFAGLSIAGVVVAVIMQTRELKQQQEDQMKMLSAIQDLSNTQLHLLEQLESVAKIRNREARIQSVQGRLARLDELIDKARNERPGVSSPGSPAEQKRKNIDARIATMNAQKAALESELEELTSEE